MYHESVRDEQVKIFRAIPPLEPADLVRGQFRGYRQEPGVAPDSPIETFAAVRLRIESWRWAGVPFLIRTGKNFTGDDGGPGHAQTAAVDQSRPWGHQRSALSAQSRRSRSI